MNHDEIQRKLVAPFPDGAVKFKPGVVSGSRALALPYVDARAIQDRLDEIFGINGWKDDYIVLSDGSGSVICKLSLLINGEWITKCDVGGQSQQPDDGDKMKAAFSDALKRAAVKFGIGRYLYRKPPTWVDYDVKTKRLVMPQEAYRERPAPAVPSPPASEPLTSAQYSRIADLVDLLNFNEKSFHDWLMKRYQVKDIKGLTSQQADNAIQAFEQGCRQKGIDPNQSKNHKRVEV